jgi:hypothetical protein
VADSLVRPSSSSRIWAGGPSATAMLILVVLLAGGDPPGSRAQVDSAMWWYVAHTSGLIAWALLGALVVGALLLATQLTQGRTRAWIQEDPQVSRAARCDLHSDSPGLRARPRPATDQPARAACPVHPAGQSGVPGWRGAGLLPPHRSRADLLGARALLAWRWWRRQFFTRALKHRLPPTAVNTDRRTAYPGCSMTCCPSPAMPLKQYANNSIESDHGGLKSLAAVDAWSETAPLHN